MNKKINEALSFTERGYEILSVRPAEKGSRFPGWNSGGRNEATLAYLRKDIANNYSILTGEASGVVVLDCDVPREGDKHKSGFEKLLDIFRENDAGHPNSLGSPVTVTPSGGRHYFFKWKCLDFKSQVEGTLIDILSDRRQVMGVGSAYAGCDPEGKKAHKCGAPVGGQCEFQGKTYRWLRMKGGKTRDLSCPLPEIPEWLEKFLIKKPITIRPCETNEEPAEEESSSVDIYVRAFYLVGDQFINEFHSYIKLVWAACDLGVPEDEIYRICAKGGRNDGENCTQGLIRDFDPAKIDGRGVLIYYLKKSIDGGEKKEKIKEVLALLKKSGFMPDSLFLSSEGDRLISSFFRQRTKSVLKFTSGSGEGYFYNKKEKLWKYQDKYEMRNQMCNFLWKKKDEKIKALMGKREEASAAQGEHIDFIVKRSNDLGKNSKINSVWGLAKNPIEKEFADRLNNYDFYLPVSPGLVLDFRNLTSFPRTKDHLFTFSVPFSFREGLASRDVEQLKEAAYDPSVFPNALRFFSDLSSYRSSKGGMLVDKEILEYLHLLCGMFLIKKKFDRHFYIFWGRRGRNGKSTLVSLLKKILGDEFAPTLQDRVFIKKGDTSHESHLLPLQKARVAILSESDEGDTVNSSLIKRIVGNDSIRARACMSPDSVDFKSEAKLVIMTNKRPRFDGTDQAMIDRIRIIPFRNRFEKDDPEFEERLYRNLDEIFTWLCVGARLFLEEKTLPFPQVMQKVLKEYVTENDPIQLWSSENCESSLDKGARLDDLFLDYQVWSEGEFPMRKLLFKKGLQDKGYEIKRKEQGIFVKGLCLKSE